MKKITLYKLGSAYKSRVFNSGKWIDGKRMEELEERLKVYLSVKYLVLTNSGTSALLAAYWVLKEKFNELTIDPYTFPASYQTARMLGYKIRFKRTTLTNESMFLKKSLTTIVHLYGQPNPLLSKANDHIFVEDACQAFGAEFKGNKVGTLGIMGCYSFYPTKPLHTCGHGGAVVTNNKSLYRKLKVFIESGRINGRITDNIALNLRMDEIKAEYLLRELGGYDKKVEKQRELAKEYLEFIPTHQPFLEEQKDTKHIYSVFNLLVKRRGHFRRHMRQLGIETLVYYGKDVIPQSERSKYKDITGSLVAIPCRWSLTETERRRVKFALESWFEYEANP